jgi:hypothetical protein
VRARPSWVAIFLSLVVLGVPTIACNTLLGIGDPVDAGREVPGRGGIGWWSGRGDRGCFTAGAPGPEDRPPPAGDGDVGPIYLALESMRLGSLNEEGVLDSNAWQDLGFDLDGLCTASETCDDDTSPFSCKPGASTIARDGRHCRDNTFGRLEHAAAGVPELTQKYGLSDDAVNCALCVGHYNFLIRITGYNGEPNDDNVRLDLYPSPGLERRLPWDCTEPDWNTRPCFQPDMPWTVLEDGVEERRGGPDLPNATLFDDAAYVREGYLIMKLPVDTLFWFPGHSAPVVAFPMTIAEGTLSGRIERRPDGVWRMDDGIIAGRSRGSDIIAGFRRMGFCEEDSNYELMTTFVRSNLDLLAGGHNDANEPCDAMSFGLGFRAVQATPGQLATVEPLEECVLKGPAAERADGGN